MATTISGADGWGLDDAGTSDFYVLRLFVNGASSNSVRAIANLKSICETYLPGRFSLEVVDVRKQDHLTEEEQVIALPMLIKAEPLPARRLIGDMGDTARVLRGLGLQP